MEEKEKQTYEEDFPISHVSASVTCNHTLRGGPPPSTRPLNGPLNSTLRIQRRLIILEGSSSDSTRLPYIYLAKKHERDSK
jgi:hypothetical protein